MLVTVKSDSYISSYAFPSGADGVHVLRNQSGEAFASIESEEGSWSVAPVEPYCFSGFGGSPSGGMSINVHERTVFSFEGRGEVIHAIVSPDSEGFKTTRTYGFVGPISLAIGRSSNSEIAYDNQYVSSRHAVLKYDGTQWVLSDLGSSNGVFVNSRRAAVKQPMVLSFGDAVTILDLNITVGKGLFSLNNPNDSVTVNADGLQTFKALDDLVPLQSDEDEREYFYPALRFMRTVKTSKFAIDEPPVQQKPDEESLAMKIGPSLFMGLASVLSAAVCVSSMSEQGGSAIRALPAIAMAISMLMGSVLWPILSKKNQEKKRRESETRRRAAYSQYLTSVRNQILSEMSLQKEILEENRVSVEMCLSMAARRDPHLMDRLPIHGDYLQVRIGNGDVPFDADITFPKKGFSIDEDDLREAVDEFAAEPRVLQRTPIAYSLFDQHVMGIVGGEGEVASFLRGIIVQIATQYSYERVKIMFMCEKADRETWRFVSRLPHVFSDDKQLRYFACGSEEADSLAMSLERIMASRREADHFSARDANPYYVVICASERLSARVSAFGSLASEPSNLGVTFISTASVMRKLPKECSSVIALDGDSSYTIDRDDPLASRNWFTPDIELSAERAEVFAECINQVRLNLEVEQQKIPSGLGFMEMLGVGSVEQLNIASRWRESNASISLASTVGVDAQGDPFVLNLHEKSHGPHGLIAGTTGSGKSEFIITWILSMALSYSPNEVAFVLIDYKGGGLAKAFENEHVTLPHLAGVITNLDGAAISRSLVSLQSELKRRQALFNMARDVSGGENVDIYKYLDLFRQGVVDVPCPHLFVVADEFAELKQQEPEFMDELISAARIGRSLGVHLVLATQKPSGVVNDQIWSNSRFKVCLKVADESDSREMLKRPDAAEITQAGRFYLLVGYNELFSMGQSGYSGMRYVEKSPDDVEVDDTVKLISDLGNSVVAVSQKKHVEAGDAGPESVVVLKRIQQVAQKLNLKAQRLWLEPIPELVTLGDIHARYADSLAACENPYDLNPVIGEYDDPKRQNQKCLTLPLSREGNALLYGTADSGLETILSTLLYSLVSEHASSTLNAYVLDFGSETLRAFSGAPQVGDVIGAGEDEKVTRFFDFIESEIAARRKKLYSYGGSFDRYVATNDDMPSILVVINDIAALVEMYETLEDRLVSLSREAGRGGIHLVVTAPNSASVRVRMRSNFRQVLAVNLPDLEEYGAVFSSVRGIALPKGFARGLVALEDGLFEFQGAHITEGGDEYAAALKLSASIAAEGSMPVAPPVPIAPESVAVDDLHLDTAGEFEVPFGIFHSSLKRASIDFAEAPVARVLYQKRKAGQMFCQAFAQVLSGLNNWDVCLFDMAGAFGGAKPEGLEFATRKVELAAPYVSSLINVEDERASAKRKLLVFTGLGAFFSGAGTDVANAFKAHLRGLQAGGGTAVLIIDSAADVNYNYEDWFKAQIGAKDGIWIGPGADSQTMIGAAYSNRFAPDSTMHGGRGYAIDGGVAELVCLVSLQVSEEE